MGASFHQKAGNEEEKAPEEKSQESSFGVRGKPEEAAEVRNGNEGRSLFFQNLSHMTSAGDTTVSSMILFADCLDFKYSR